MAPPPQPYGFPDHPGDDAGMADPLALLTEAALAHGNVTVRLPHVLARVQADFAADTAVLLLADESGSTLSVAAAVGLLQPELTLGLRIPVVAGVAGRIAAERRPIALDDLSGHPVFSPLLRDLVRSLLGVPLVVEARLLGVLHVGTRHLRRFTGREARRLQDIADLIALALDHARLYHAERVARDKAVRLAAIVEGSEDAIIGKDLDGIIRTWNAGAHKMYGYTADEVIGRHISILTPGQHRAEIDEIMRQLARGGRISHLETQRRRKNGELFDVSLTISPIRDASGNKIVGASSIAREISDLKRAERTLRTTEKLAATGRLAASIAHEINNPMASVTNLLYLLQHHETLDATAVEYVRLAQEELQRVTHIVRQMLGFYRESEAPVAVNLREIVENVLVLYARRLQSTRVRVETTFRADASIQGFPGEIRQVFSNLIVNSIEALGENGRIRIDARRSRDWSNPPGVGVRVLIADNGPGIPEEARRHICEPFFTTKGERGTGLGLWVSDGIVRKHGGVMRVRSSTSERRHGTCFSVFFPLEPSALKRAA